MKSLIDRVKHQDFWSFNGGIHPPEQKFLTNSKPIRQVCMPDEIILPIQQHIGQAGKLLIAEGDYVLKGQALTQHEHTMMVPVHAPTSGHITAIKLATIAHPSGMQETCIFIKPDNEDKWRPRQICHDYTQLTSHEIVERIAHAGIAGMGGAGFPTHIKINTHSAIETLIINAAECEPYITADDLLIKEHSPSILDGIRILCQMLSPKQVLIGIEDNKPDAIKALEFASQHDENIHVCILPTKYPTGGEKQLIQCLTGKEVPSGILPSSLGIIMQNIATCFAIAEAVIHDIPLIKRVVTVTGMALVKPQNVWALLGTPIENLLNQCNYQTPKQKHIIMGGPMMGYSLPNTQVPVVKTTNCILAPSEAEIPSGMYQDSNEVECIRCGQCAEVCPSKLLPQELQWSAKAKDQVQLEKLNLFDCIECGACAYVCPSQIPLVHYYRIGKAEIRQQKALDLKAEKAKIRFEARKVRLEKEKKAREEKHKKAAEARKARMNANTSEAKSEKSAVAAALARVKAKKAQASGANESTAIDTEPKEISPVAAAIARAKAKKLAAKQAQEKTNIEQSEITVSVETPSKSSPTDDKKAKIAAAIAKAKAKKSLETSSEGLPSSDVIQKDETLSEIKTSAATDKKAKIAAAIAKAKAKKAQAEKINHNDSAAIHKENEAQNSTSVSAPPVTATEDKKAKIAAAIAKAKAKKQQRSESI